jgi:hypothetical protein
MNTAATPMCLCVSRQQRDTRCMKLNTGGGWGGGPGGCTGRPAERLDYGVNNLTNIFLT